MKSAQKWQISFLLLLSGPLFHAVVKCGIFTWLHLQERYPTFFFNIHWLLIIKGMYLNYKYTSYTEVGKAGVLPEAKFLHYPLFSSLPSPYACLLFLCHLQKHQGIPLYFPTPPHFGHPKKIPPTPARPHTYVCCFLEVGCHTCLKYNESLSSRHPWVPNTPPLKPAWSSPLFWAFPTCHKSSVV